MNLMKRLRAAAEMAIFGETQTLGAESGWLFRAVGGRTDAGITVSQWSAITYPAVWACVTLIADTIGQLPVDVLRRTAGGGREEVPDHPVARVLNASANEEMGAATVKGGAQMHALLWGNGYAEIQRNRRQELVGLWPLLPESTWPDVRFPQARRTLAYRTTINGRQVELEPGRVLHIKWQSHDGICGLSPIAVARQAIGLGQAMEKFGSKFFANDSRSGGYLMHPGKLGGKAVENIQESFDQQGGPDNAFKVKVLEEGMKYLPTTIPPDDAQFLESRTFQTSEIARIYRVPLILLQMAEGSTVWGTGIEQILIAFARFTLRPWIVRWEEELGRKLLSDEERRAGFYLKFNLNALLAGDSKARADFYNIMVTIGVMTRNEARELEDLNALPGLEVPLVQANMQRADAMGQGDDDAEAA